MFLKNRNISSKIKRSKVTEYAALKLLRPTVEEKIQLHETARTNIRAHAWTEGRTDAGADSDGPTLVQN